MGRFIDIFVEGLAGSEGKAPLADADAYLDAIAERLAALAEVFPRMGAAGLAEVRRNFTGQHDPDGVPWAPLSTREPPKGGYAGWKARHYGGQPILQLSGQLIGALGTRAGADYVEIGVIGGPEWSAIHNYGGGAIPAREYAGTSDAFLDRLAETLASYMESGEWGTA